MTFPSRMAALLALTPLLALWPGPGMATHAPAHEHGMPDLSALALRTDPQVHGQGRIIKGLYYIAEPGGPNELVAFFNACDRRLESHPFLIFDFGAQRYYFDADRDGRIDETGLQDGGVDPVSFAQREAGWASYCYGETAG